MSTVAVVEGKRRRLCGGGGGCFFLDDNDCRKSNDKKEEHEKETRVSKNALVQWYIVDFHLEIYRGDIPCRAGDCLFACVAWWLNNCCGKTLFTPFLVRMLAASSVDVRFPFIATLCEELSSDLDRKIDPTNIIPTLLSIDTWGNNGILILLARALSLLFSACIGFVVIQIDNFGCIHPHPLCIPDIDHIEFACVLVHINDNHYNIAVGGDGGACGGRESLLVFHPRSKCWQTSWEPIET